MRTDAFVRARKWAIYAALLAGMAYSFLGVISQPVHASSCDCNEAWQDAQDICNSLGEGSVVQFSCPVGSTPDFTWYCTPDGVTYYGLYYRNCNFF